MKIFSQTLNLNKLAEQAITVPLNSGYGIAWKVEANGKDVTNNSSIAVNDGDSISYDSESGYIQLDNQSGKTPTTKKMKLEVRTSNLNPKEGSYSKNLISEALTNIVNQAWTTSSGDLSVGDVEVRINSITGDTSLASKVKVGVWYPASLKVSNTQYNSATYSNGEYTLLPKWKAAIGASQKDTLKVSGTCYVVLPIMVSPSETTTVNFTVRVQKSESVTNYTTLIVNETDQGYFEESFTLPEEPTFKKLTVSDSGYGVITSDEIKCNIITANYVTADTLDVANFSAPNATFGCTDINFDSGIEVWTGGVDVKNGCVIAQNLDGCTSVTIGSEKIVMNVSNDYQTVLEINGKSFTMMPMTINGMDMYILAAPQFN